MAALRAGHEGPRSAPRGRRTRADNGGVVRGRPPAAAGPHPLRVSASLRRGPAAALKAGARLAGLAVLVLAGCKGNIGDVDTLALVTVRLSVRHDGSQAVDDSRSPRISADGRFVSFDSDATDLVLGDINAAADVFVKDRLTGAVELVSLTAPGLQFTLSSLAEAISGDGRFVTFRTEETGGFMMVYRRDRLTRTTTRVINTAVSVNSDVVFSDISDDGRFVVFRTFASNIPGFTNPGPDIQVYLSDLSTAPPTLTLVSATTALGTTGGNGNSFDPDITGDGGFVVFASDSTDLQGVGTDASADVFLWTRGTGALSVVSINPSGAEANGSCGEPTISDDARFVAFETTAPNMQPIRVAVRDRTLATTVSAYDEPFLGGLTFSTTPRISRGGRFVVWFRATDTVAGPSNGHMHVYRRDLATGEGIRVSVNSLGEMATATSSGPDVSADGSWVVWHSAASNLVEDDTNGLLDVFARGSYSP